MRRRSPAGIAEGALVLTALACVPAALVAALDAPVTTGFAALVDALVVVAVASWVVVTAGLGRLVAEQLRGGDTKIVERGPLGWAAIRVVALILCVAPFLEHAGHASASPRGGSAGVARPRSGAITLELATPPPAVARGGRVEAGPVRVDVATSAAHQRRDVGSSGRGARGSHRCRPAPASPVPLGTGAILVPLAADARRRARLAQRVVVDDEGAVDVETALLASPAAPTSLLIGVARALTAVGGLPACAHVVLAEGEAWLDDGTWRFDPGAAQIDARCLCVVLGEAHGRTHVVLVPRGGVLALQGPGAVTLVDDAIRVSPALGLGRPVRTGPAGLVQALALREDDDVVVCEGELDAITPSLLARCVAVTNEGETLAEVTDTEVRLIDGRVLDRSSLATSVRALLDGHRDRPLGAPQGVAADGGRLDDEGVVVRLLTAIPRVDGLAAPLEPNRERRAVELLAYLALRAGQPVTGERLRVRVLGTPSDDAAAKTLFNVASCLRRSLGDGPFGPRLPAAGRAGHYAVAADVRCDVAVLEARVAQAGRCDDPEAKMAWLRGALELIEAEPFATVLEGYDWFLAEGHVARLQTACEDAACELVDLALAHGLVELAAFAVDRASLVDPHAERLAEAAMRVVAARQASLAAMVPAARSTAPSAPAVV